MQQAIEDANLGSFAVRDSGTGKRELLSSHPASNAPATSLGLIRSKGIPLQNSEAFALFQPLLDRGLLSIDSVCEWKGGWRVWMVFEILKYPKFDDLDPLRPFLLFGHNPLTNYFKLSYLFVRTATNGILTEGTFHNPAPNIPPEDGLPRRFAAGYEKACEEMAAHLKEVMTRFELMKRRPISAQDADHYFFDVATRVENFRQTGLGGDQIGRLDTACKERLSRQDLRVEEEPGLSLWAAYNTVVEWVDQEANALHAWERLKELWFSSIKDDALYEAIKRIDT